MAKLKTYSIDAIIGRGRTLTDAKADCMERVQVALRGLHDGPRVIQFRDETWICAPDVHGHWEYGRVQPQTYRGWRLIGAGHESIEECERRARRHLAQYTYQGGNDTASADVILEESDRRDHLSWVRWQVGYAEHRAQGMTDEQARGALF